MYFPELFHLSVVVSLSYWLWRSPPKWPRLYQAGR